MGLCINNAMEGAEFFVVYDQISTQGDILAVLLAASSNQERMPSEKLFTRIGVNLPGSYKPLLIVA